MKSLTVESFWTDYRRLPEAVRKAAREAFDQFRDNPHHPGLWFKPLAGFEDYWSVRITRSYRAVGKRQGDAIVWFWIGSHARFDREFS